MIDKLTIDRIFAAADIAEVVGDFVQLKRKGVNYTACCPFHNEKTPSFIVSPAKGLYKCFGCGKGGGAVNFVMEHEKLSYPEALHYLAKKYNIPIQEQTQSPEQKQTNDDRESMMVLSSWAQDYFEKQLLTDKGKAVGLSYFRERGFTDQTIKSFGLGYCPDTGDEMTTEALKQGYKIEYLEKTGLSAKSQRSAIGYYDKLYGRVIFPIHSLSGRVIGFGGRTLRSSDKAKYLNSPESEIYHKSNTLYGIYFAKREIVNKNKCILVEGYTDVLQMHQSGVENVVASSGTSLTEEQIKLIKRFTHNVTVIYDGDSAGIKASMRGIDMILRAGLSVRVVPLPAGEDPDSFARAHNATQLEKYIEQKEEDFLSFKTRILLDGVDNDPIKRAELITDIIGSIAVIPDSVQRSVFIRECSTMLDVEREVLEREVRRRVATFDDGPVGRAAVQSQQQKERFLAQQQAAPLADLSQRKDSVLGQIDMLERELTSYLIRYGHENFTLTLSPTESLEMGVAQAIIDDLERDNIAMLNPLYNKILQAFMEDNNLGIDDLLSTDDTALSQLIADLSFERDNYRPSAIWEKYEIHFRSEREMLSQAIPKALSIYKSLIVSYQIEQIQVTMETETDPMTQMALSQRIMELNAIRTAIAKHFQRS
ncbi:MAG: DNA primase [Mucinivorans sp.]